MKKNISIFLLSIVSITTYAAIPFTEQTLVPFFSDSTEFVASSIDININGRAIATWYEPNSQWLGSESAIVATFYDPNSGWGSPHLVVDNQAGAPGSSSFFMIPAIGDSNDAQITWISGNSVYISIYNASSDSWGSPTLIDTVSNTVSGAQTSVNNTNNTFSTFVKGVEFYESPGNNSEKEASSDDGQYRVQAREISNTIISLAYAPGEASSLANDEFLEVYNLSVNNNGNVICVYYVRRPNPDPQSSNQLQSIRATVYTPGTGWSSAVQIGPEFELVAGKNILVSLNNNDEALLVATTDSNPENSNFSTFFSARLTNLQNNTWEIIPNTEPNNLYIHIEQMALGLGDNGAGITLFNRFDENDFEAPPATNEENSDPSGPTNTNDPSPSNNPPIGDPLGGGIVFITGNDSAEYRVFTPSGPFPNQWRSFFTLFDTIFLSKLALFNNSIGPYGFAYNSTSNYFAAIASNLQTAVVSDPSQFIQSNLINRNIIVNPLLNILSVGQDQPQNFTAEVYRTNYGLQREHFAQLSWQPPHIVSLENLTSYLIFHNKELVATLPPTQQSFEVHNIDINESNEFRVAATFNGQQASPGIITLTPQFNDNV